MAKKSWPNESLMYTAHPPGTIVIGYHNRNAGSRMRLLNAHSLSNIDKKGKACSTGSMSHLEVEIIALDGDQADLFSDHICSTVKIGDIQIAHPNPGQSFFHANGWIGEEDFYRLIVRPEFDHRFAENAVKYGWHKRCERNATVVKLRKEQYRKDTSGRMPCECCSTSFVDLYDFEYLEAHHKIPLSMLKPGVATTPDDLALLCANCHRAIHRVKDGIGILSVEAFKARFFPST